MWERVTLFGTYVLQYITSSQMAVSKSSTARDGGEGAGRIVSENREKKAKDTFSPGSVLLKLKRNAGHPAKKCTLGKRQTTGEQSQYFCCFQDEEKEKMIVARKELNLGTSVKL